MRSSEGTDEYQAENELEFSVELTDVPCFHRCGGNLIKNDTFIFLCPTVDRYYEGTIHWKNEDASKTNVYHFPLQHYFCSRCDKSVYLEEEDA